MKEIKNVLEAYQQIDFTKTQAALALVVRVEGSSYRRIGARMLVTDTGQLTGGISGGCLEGDALKRAKLAIAQQKASLVTYDTSDDDPFQIGVGLGCNGIIDVLLCPINPSDASNPVAILSEVKNSRQSVVVLTVVGIKGQSSDFELGNTYLPHHQPVNLQNLTFEYVEKCKNSQKSFTQNIVLGNDLSLNILFEFLPPALHLLVHGSNYDIYPMAKLAKEIGWKVSVFCNVLKVNTAIFEMADEVLPKETLPIIDEFSACVLMAHDYQTDFDNLCQYLKTDIKYIALLGPKKRTEKMFLALKNQDYILTNSDLARIYSPAGLDIGATFPEEIALSILAEIKACFTSRNGQFLKHRKTAIYD